MELAKDCIRTCHVLKSVTEGSGGGPDNRGVEDLGRCVNRTKSALPTITSDTRIIRHIEFVVRERADHPRDLQENHPESTEERLIVWRTKMLEILRVFDVRGQLLPIPMVSQLPQARGGLGAGEIGQHVHRPTNMEPLTPASVMVRYPLSTSGVPRADCPLNVEFVSAIYR